MLQPEPGALLQPSAFHLASGGGGNLCQDFKVLENNLGSAREKMADEATRKWAATREPSLARASAGNLVPLPLKKWVGLLQPPLLNHAPLVS